MAFQIGRLTHFRKGHGAGSGAKAKGNRWLAFFLFLGLWCILSGRFDAFHLGLGVVACGLVALLSGDLLFPEGTGGLLRRVLGFLGYLPWLFLEIFKANLHVMYLVFHPRMREIIDPRIIRFRSVLRHEISLVTLANSITLTPGTITVYVSVDGHFKVHAIDRASAEALPGEMERRVAKALEEG